jgi:hypothetical protein
MMNPGFLSILISLVATTVILSILKFPIVFPGIELLLASYYLPKLAAFGQSRVQRASCSNSTFTAKPKVPPVLDVFATIHLLCPIM